MPLGSACSTWRLMLPAPTWPVPLLSGLLPLSPLMLLALIPLSLLLMLLLTALPPLMTLPVP